MARRSSLVSALLALSLVPAGAALALRASPPKLKGTVGPGFTIHLTKAGKAVKSLKPGKYAFVISDRSSIHSFELEKVKGGRFEKELSDVSQTGTKTVTVKLTVGRYKYYCKPHESSMFGFFNVKR